MIDSVPLNVAFRHVARFYVSFHHLERLRAGRLLFGSSPELITRLTKHDTCYVNRWFLGGMTFNGRGTRRSRWFINEADERVREGDSCVFAHSVKLTRDEAVAVRAVVVSMGTKTKAPRPETHSRPVKMHPSAGRVLVLLPPPAT